MWDTTFPPLLSELHRLEFDYADGDGIDFEPYTAFMTAEETREWFRLWTGNPEVEGSVFRIFGQDGTGGYAAFWLQDDIEDILQQPIVFMGSEGETGVVAIDFASYLWVLAGGVGPYEAVAYPSDAHTQHKTFHTFAEQHSTRHMLTAPAVINEARDSYPNFGSWVESLCR
ncbi:MAG: SMI1/KNR4 family protein [Pseudomonadota bacterium]